MKYKIVVLLFVVLVLSSCVALPEESKKQMNADIKDAQIVELGLHGYGYSPEEIVVESGKPVVLHNDGSIKGCGMFVVQKELGINANFMKDDEYVFVPEEKGEFEISCSMGMYKGKIKVV